MHRISPNNPVRRCLFPAEDLVDEAKIDNFTNILQESAATEKLEKMHKWNFDFENEIALEGTWEWFKGNDSADWIGMETQTQAKFACEDALKGTNDENFMTMKLDNELTPKNDKVEKAPMLRKRRKEVVDNAFGGARGVKRRISFE
ncbi:unnamed protein product [Parnassius apollo]|uniref:(apollo) hypothetical protein n=1 Tax=Parnassius apollo TaxID=110799 RepID=A0A8S3Y8B5_PARAO|nr:unnamed protein product [Parnassius apollo]